VLKTRSKKISLLLVLMMLATMFVGVGTASAAGSITALTTPTATDDPTINQEMGTIKVYIPAGSITSGDSVIFKLPKGFDFATGMAAVAATHTSATANQVVVPAALTYDTTNVNGLSAAQIQQTIKDADDEIQLTALADQSTTQDFEMYIYLPAIEVESGTTDDCIVNFDAPGNSGFVSGTVVVGKASSSGSVTLAVSGTDTSDDAFNFELRVKEDTAGSLDLDDETLKLKLPSGFVWDNVAATNTVLTALWGQNIIVDINVDDEELTIDFKGVDVDDDGVADAAEFASATAVDTTEASAWDIPATVLRFGVDDEDAVDIGDVTMTISGETDVNISSAVVGTYGEIGATITAKTTPDIISGQDEQEIGNIIVKESIGESLVDNRTITFTLPTGCRWQGQYEDDIANPDTTTGDLPNFESDEGINLTFTEFSGTDDRTAKFTVGNAVAIGGDAAELELKNVEIAVEPGFEGDVKLEVAGTSGITATSVVVAKAKSAVSATASSAPDVVIGLSNQVAGDFTVKENIAAGFQDDGTAILRLPAGCVWVATPDVKVTEGDLKITNIQRGDSDRNVTFTIDAESSSPSTISVTNAKIKIDRTVAEGDITVKVQGSAVAETGGAWSATGNTRAYSDWANSDTAAKCVIAKVTTPAGEVGSTAVFSFGSTTYKINGIEKTASVAPYAENNRTFMSIRDVAYALGITDDNIVWNQENQTVTLIKDGKFVQCKLGSTEMLVGGVTISMDVAVSAKDNFTTLPASWVAKAFGSTATYDAATNTVTIK